MRHVLNILLLGVTLAVIPNTGFAEDKPVNTICPVTGQPVNSAIAPIIVTIGKGERSQKILIGVADADAATKVKNNPTAYIKAAKANKKAD